MAQLLDYRSSQNSNRDSGTPGTPIAIAPAAPTFIGDIGLIVGTATNVRVNLWATVGLANTSTTNGAIVRLFIARNLNPTNIFIAENVVFSADEELEALTGDFEEITTLNASDINVSPGPVPQQINYSLFAQVQTPGVTVTRNGPENLTGMAIG